MPADPALDLSFEAISSWSDVQAAKPINARPMSARPKTTPST